MTIGDRRQVQLPSGYADRTDLRRHATRTPLLAQPVHRWFTFPHSYSHQLVGGIIRQWRLSAQDRIFDPFVGAGTTLVVAREMGIPAFGLDVSPLAVFAANLKVSNLLVADLQQCWEQLSSGMPQSPPPTSPPRSRLLRRAFSQTAWAWWCWLSQRVEHLASGAKRDFFTLALLQAMREVCRAVSDGGWLRWTRQRITGADLPQRWAAHVASMLQDVENHPWAADKGRHWSARLGDARFLENDIGEFSAVICSPPYPNRHDYTRVFAPELLLGFLDSDGLRTLRYNSFQSQVEARSPCYAHNGYQAPGRLAQALAELHQAPVTDRRVVPMVEGYFRDTFEMLCALKSHLCPGAHLAFVVGNVRHAGVMIEVDQALADVGQMLGYSWEGSWVIRLRGNSAQQMGTFGREPARESVVFLRLG
ncbi:MAG: hypothetical protein HY335_03195 [Deinococcus sp.]|nr:hypothetical protein [Deinococcus sp.]